MKLNINWREIGIQILKAIWPVIAGALTGATVVMATGCTSMATQPQGPPRSSPAAPPPSPGYPIPRNWQKIMAATPTSPTNAVKQIMPVTTAF
ncbi:MAG: hypothetical protein MJ240_14315 [Kiritimatiellae bacterium]|nr:hypothetical protein [Kiritimatiellia bacterium]